METNSNRRADGGENMSAADRLLVRRGTDAGSINWEDNISFTEAVGVEQSRQRAT